MAYLVEPTPTKTGSRLYQSELRMKPPSQQPVVLVAEADPIVSIDVCDALEVAGCRVIGPACTTEEALQLLEREKPDVAVIDVALRDGSCAEFADTLRRLAVPFLVHSGSWQDQQSANEFKGAPWLTKPAHTGDVIAYVRTLLRRSAVQASATRSEAGASATSGNPMIRKLEGFATLSDADRTVLARISAGARPVAAGINLAREGDQPDGVVLVMDGLACRHKLRANGARQIMAYLVPGDMCDLDVALLRRMDHTISTLSACMVVRLAPETVVDLLANHPRIARALRIAQLVDEATLREWLVNVGRRSASERLAHLFCELLLRLQAVGRASADAYALPLTQTDLADSVGLTPVHVSRTLGELRRKGLIELSRSRVRILNEPELRVMAEFRSNYLHLGEQAAA